ncbi:MAG: hypothetical protein AAGA56_03975 [Myxococcota bacterium]
MRTAFWLGLTVSAGTVAYGCTTLSDDCRLTGTCALPFVPSDGVGGMPPTASTAGEDPTTSGTGEGGGGSEPVPPGIVWQRAYGDAGADSLCDIVVDSSDNIYAAGRFTGNISFDDEPGNDLVATGTDTFLARLAGNGASVWSARFDVGCVALSERSGRVYYGGSYSTSDQAIPFGSLSLPASLQTASWFVAGVNAQSGELQFVLPSSSNRNNYLRSFDSQSQSWVMVEDRLSERQVFSSEVRLFRGTTSLNDVPFAPRPRHVVYVDSNTIYAVGAFSGSVTIGEQDLTSEGSSDVFVTRLDSSLAPTWSRSFGSSAAESPNDVGFLEDGTIVIVGSSRGDFEFGQGAVANGGEVDAFVVTLADDGTPLSAASFGGAGIDTFSSIAVGGGLIAMAGSVTDDISVGDQTFEVVDQDALVVALDDATLVPQFAAVGSGLGEQSTTAIEIDSLGRTIVGGTFQESINFGGGPLASAGDTDAFLVQFEPN